MRSKCGYDSSKKSAYDVARGTAAHSSHALHVSNALLKTAQNKTSYEIIEPEKT